MSQPFDHHNPPWRSPDAEPFIRLCGISKQFGSFTAVDTTDLDIYQGELFSLLGGSGCGKTTLLRMLAGFEEPTTGRIFIDGVDMTETPPYERPVNMMFQSYALFPHMDVEKNIAYGLQRGGIVREEIRHRVAEMLQMVELSQFARRKPHQLSGGQRQRVALARALVKQPKVLLLDEPLGALDKRLREQTQFELMRIQEQLGITFIVVTHDQEEAMTLSTRMVVMDHGKLMQLGTPTEIYEYPQTRLVASFIGSANLFEGRVVEDGVDHVVVHSSQYDLDFHIDHGVSINQGTRVWVAIRPEKISISREPSNQRGNQIKGVVSDIGYLGRVSTYRVTTSAKEILEVSCPNQSRTKGVNTVDWDDEVYLSWAPSSGVVLTK